MDDFHVVVTSPGSFKNYKFMKSKLDNLLINKSKDHHIVILTDGCKGAGNMAMEYAGVNNYGLTVFKPMWDKFGGRSKYIAQEALCVGGDAIVIFHNNTDKNTNNIIKMSDRYGLDKRIYIYF